MASHCLDCITMWMTIREPGLMAAPGRDRADMPQRSAALRAGDRCGRAAGGIFPVIAGFAPVLIGAGITDGAESFPSALDGAGAAGVGKDTCATGPRRCSPPSTSTPSTPTPGPSGGPSPPTTSSPPSNASACAPSTPPRDSTNSSTKHRQRQPQALPVDQVRRRHPRHHQTLLLAHPRHRPETAQTHQNFRIRTLMSGYVTV